jgi:hypothetical protein
MKQPVLSFNYVGEIPEKRSCRCFLLEFYYGSPLHCATESFCRQVSGNHRVAAANPL